MLKLLKNFRLLDDELYDRLVEADEDEQGSWLILSPHPHSPIHWIVNCLQPDFFLDFEELIGQYRAVHPDALDDFLALADELGYEVAFESDPNEILAPFTRLEDPPPFELDSPLPNTVSGFLPFQLREFNWLKDQNYGAAVWSTGTGKTVLAASLLKYHALQDNYDLGVFCVKTNNKLNTQRKIKRIVDVDSIVVEGTPTKRDKVYAEVCEMMEAGERPVMILNYEKFRDDFITEWDEKKPEGLSEYAERLFTDTRVLAIWDEMPMKLKNRGSGLYRAVNKVLYDTQVPQVSIDRLRPAKTIQYMLNATPIENNPEDFFNCVRLMDGGQTFGTVKEFRAEHVASYNYFNKHKPEKWKNSDKMFLKSKHFTSLADRNDPEIAAMFPEVIEEPYYIEWDPKDRKIYDTLTGKAGAMLEMDWEDANPLALMGVMQMMCDLPSMINESAAKREEFEAALEAFIEADDPEAEEPSRKGSEAALELLTAIGALSDERHTKLAALKEILTEDHPGEKTLVFSAYGDLLLPALSRHLTEWGIKHVVYAGTDKEKQKAEDAFRSDPSILVFLSSDAGSDSIDLEIASVGINYDLPWQWSRKKQRTGRNDRVTSRHKQIIWYTLTMVNSVEDRRVKLIANKLGYHEGVFFGVSDEEIKSIRMDKGDLWYMLTGREVTEDQP